ncbi:hypothetical protein M9Y10_026762 [Tritrichomonas musculus]|uniref:DUF3447 domain-containing protein n=1 Tax=Tritrichomonas musculus TaxID=1915356 RepID=A0ABR2H6G1_9EUKA
MQGIINLQEYLDGKKEIQKEILSLLSEQNPSFISLKKYIEEQKIHENVHNFRSFLYLLVMISNNHHRSPYFFNNLEAIILLFKDDFSRYLASTEIYNIFYTSKQIVHILLKNKITTMENLYPLFPEDSDQKTHNFFFNEMKQFLSEDSIKKIEEENDEIEKDPDQFERNREIGENETYLCQLIRSDSIDDFIIHINKKSISLKTIIKTSIFETNFMIINKEPSLIEYAAFFGSIQIFNYLRLNSIELTPDLWIYAIHGQNAEIIHLLEEFGVEPPNKSYDICLIEAIICHHNDIANYFVNKYFDQDVMTKNERIKTEIIISYNYEFFPNDFSDEKTFFDLCRIDNFPLFEYMINHNKSLNIECKKKMEIDDDKHIFTPFLVSIRNDNTNIFEYLIKRPEIDVNSIGLLINWNPFHEKTSTPLFHSIWMENPKIVRLLLEHEKIDANMKSYNKSYYENDGFYTVELLPLHEAIFSMNIEIIKLLLSCDKIDVNLTCQSYYSRNNYTQKFEEYGPFPKIFMVDNISIDIVKLFINHPNIDINQQSYLLNGENDEITDTPLTFSIRNKKFDIAKLLLNHPNIDVNSKYIVKNIQRPRFETKSALYLAIENKNDEIIDLLLANSKIDVNFQSTIDDSNSSFNEKKSVLYFAVENNNENLVKKLLSFKDIDVNYISLFINNPNKKIKKIPILHKAIENGNLQIVKYLLSSPNIDINIKSIIKRSDKDISKNVEKTTLQYAIVGGNIEIIKLLLANKNIDFNQKSCKLVLTPDSLINEEYTPLEISLVHDNADIFMLLFDHFTKIEKPTSEYLDHLFHMTKNEKIKKIIASLIK